MAGWRSSHSVFEANSKGYFLSSEVRGKYQKAVTIVLVTRELITLRSHKPIRGARLDVRGMLM